jgi:hypothetical protein
MADRSHGPLKVLLVPLFPALDALPATAGGDIGRCYLTDAQDRLTAPLGWTSYDLLITNGTLGGDAV